MQYDTLGRKVQMDDPNLGVWLYTYDANGNLKTRSDFKDQTISFDYDELNRPLSKTYSTGDPTVTWVYDNLSIVNGRGRLYSVSNTQVTDTVNAYDALGRKTSVSRTFAGDDNAYTTRYRYDLAGRVDQLTYPDGYILNYVYQSVSGLLRDVQGNDWVYYAKLGDYTPAGQVGRIDYGASFIFNYGSYQYMDYVSVDRFSYSPQNARLEKITSQSTGSGDYLQWIEYKYTPAGDIRQKTDNVRGNTYTYTYDKLHRLVEELAEGFLPPMANTTFGENRGRY